MTESRAWLTQASDLWHGGDALEVGRILYERLAVKDRPSWAGRILDVCCAGRPTVPAEVREVREIAFAPARWSDAHRAFQAVRTLVLEAERATQTETLELGILLLAENVAKVTYNASGCSGPFDHDAGWRVAKNARWIVDHSPEELDGRVWAALAGQPDISDVNKLDARDLRLLWVGDYYDGPLDGAILVAGKLRWYQVFGEVDLHRRYVVYELSESEMADEQYWHALFVEHVGNHWTYRDDGADVMMKPESEHAKFYEPYAKRTPVDYSRNPIVGWFEL